MQKKKKQKPDNCRRAGLALGMGGAEGVPGRSQVAARGGHAGRCRGAVSGRCQRAASLAAPFRRAMAFRELGRWRWRRVAASWGGRSVRLSEARQEAYTRVPPEPAPAPAPAGPQPGGSSRSPRRRAPAAVAGPGESGSAAKPPLSTGGRPGRRAGALGK